MPTDSEVVTGYYRYTDIWFEWYASSVLGCVACTDGNERYKVIADPDDGAVLKAILGQSIHDLPTSSH